MKLKDLIESNNTGLDAIKRAPIVEYDTGIRCLRIGDISNNRPFNDWGYTEVEDNNYKKFKLKKDDIIVARTGATIGVNKYIDKDYKSVYNNGLIRIRVKEENNPKYVYYLLQSNSYRNFIKTISMGTSTQPNMQMNDLLNLEVPEFDRDKQDKIVQLLGNIDKKIELNNEINNNLHDLAEQQFNEIYLKGSPKKLGELLVNISTGSRPKGGAQDCGVPSIGAEKIEKFGVYNYSSEKYISEEYYEKLKNGKLNSGDVLLYKDGAYTGKVSMCLNDFPHKKAAVNEHVFILNTNNNWAQNYLYFTLYNMDNKEMIHRLACSKAAQPGLNQIELKSVEVNICDEKEIINFENSVKPIMEKISSNTLENKKLVELRDTLLPKLMNGEIDLDNIEI